MVTNKIMPSKNLTRERLNKGTLWSNCDIKFQSIMLVFQVKLFATLARGNAASFYQSYATKGTQTSTTFIQQNKMKGIVLFALIL